MANIINNKVMNDGSAYARIRSQDEHKIIQFLTVCTNHKRSCDSLREQLISRVAKEFKAVENPMEFCYTPL